MRMQKFLTRLFTKAVDDKTKALYEALVALRTEEDNLLKRITQLPEENAIWHRVKAGERQEAWSLDRLRDQKFSARGWPIQCDENQDYELKTFLGILLVQAEGTSGPVNIALIMKDARKKISPRQRLVDFVEARIDDIKAVAEEFKTVTFEALPRSVIDNTRKAPPSLEI